MILHLAQHTTAQTVPLITLRMRDASDAVVL